ncbi:MAG: hypothetical protein ABJV68_31335 [Paracoccaceae bacterium]
MLSAETALSELSASILFQNGFPQWEPNTDADDALERRSTASSSAIEMARKDVGQLQKLVQLLGEMKYEPSVPILAELWLRCALIPVRISTGHALIEIGSEDALIALEETLNDPERFSCHMAVKAVFIRTPDKAFDRLSPYFEDSRHPGLAGEVFSFLQRDLDLPGWPNHVPSLVDRDNRWLLQCAILRNDMECGHLARELLRTSPQDIVDAALAEVRKKEEKAGLHAPPRVKRDGTLLRRYHAGEFNAVWNEIHEVGDVSGDYYDEVLEVADATMARVAENADLIAEKLASEGWRALSSEYSDLRTCPVMPDLEIIDRIECVSKELLPPSLKAFWRKVGGINWVWDYNAADPHPTLGVDLPLDEMDPLCVDPPGAVSYLIDDWELYDRSTDPELLGPLVLELAPDHYHKANISGGQSYSILLPSKLADPIFEFEPHRLPFVDYLRLAFEWCGFPGLAGYSDRADLDKFLRRLGLNDLKPF